jgi:hypothetical protein
MFNRIHTKLGTAGFIISIVALVAALGGGAYAASGGLSGKQKKEVEKIAKSVSKPGKTGATGATGPAGAKGDAGTAGAKGDTGAAGAAGAAGTNGAPGNPGPEGSPWTLGGTLPEGATETGVWTLSGVQGAEVSVPLSFPIPLASSLVTADVHFVPASGEGTCTGSVETPSAPEGELCVYDNALSGSVTFGGIWNSGVTGTGASRSGANLIFEGVTTADEGHGSWAVSGG